MKNAKSRPKATAQQKRETQKSPALAIIERLLAVIQDLAPGIRHIALKDYGEFNQAQIDAKKLLKEGLPNP